MNKKTRQSNIELLRIISMLLIIMFHYVYKSGYEYNDLNLNSFLAKSFWFLGELGVNLFILITGYFLVNGKFSVKKLITLICEVEFYYIITHIIAIKLNVIEPIKEWKDMILLFFPITFNRYWFITVYVLAYIISPYINILIHSMSKKQYQKLLIILIFLWCIIPTIFGFFENSTESLLYYNRFMWFIIMYLFGGYIRLYSLKIFDSLKNSILISLVSYAMLLLSVVVIFKFNNFFKYLGTTEIGIYRTPNSIFEFLLSLGIFEIFLKIKINSNVIINKLATTTLGIYMLHDGVLSYYFWNKIFMAKKHLLSTYSVLWAVLAAIIIYLVGFIIDSIRQLIEKHTIKKILDSKIFEKILKKITNFSSKIFEVM